jgi:hypothetical protein
MEKLNLKKLNELESKERCHVEVSNRFVALEDLDAELEMYSVSETNRGEYQNFSQRESRLF